MSCAKSLIEPIKNENDIFIRYYMTDLCNFNCDYCYRISFKENLYQPSKEDIDMFINNIKQYHIHNFHIIGGEPSICKNTIYLINQLIENVDISCITLTSNAYNLDFFYKLREEMLTFDGEFSLNLTYHPAYHDKVIDNFMVIENLFPKSANIYVMIDKRFMDKIHKFMERYSNSRLSFIAINNTMVVNNTKKYLCNKYCDIKVIVEFCKKYDIKWTDVRSNYVHYTPDEDYISKKCYNNFLEVNAYGDVIYDKCHFNLNSCGNIFQSNWVWNKQYIICENNFIDCKNYCRRCFHE